MYNYIMTKKQYANYEAAVAKFMFLEGIDNPPTLKQVVHWVPPVNK